MSIWKTSLASVALVLMATIATACNIPVFRYALERWQPDDCEAIVFCRGDLTDEQSQLVERLRSAAASGGAKNDGGATSNGATNLSVLVCDLDQDPPQPLVAAFKSLEKSADKPLELPYFVVRSQTPRGTPVTHWSSPLSQSAVDEVLDSPVRQELAKRLLRGDSVVWLLLKSTDETLNERARQTLDVSFRSLQTKMTIPDGIGLPGSELFSDVPLLIQFSVLEVAGDDARETLLRNMLSRSAVAGAEHDEPILVPVFGRGRALEVIPLRDVDAKLVEDLTMFLGAACSCQVKEQNPGFDLLLNVDWNRELFGEDGLAPPPSSGNGNPDKRPVLLTIPSGKKK